MKASKSLFLKLILFIGLFHSSCQRPLTGEGELIKESRSIKSFNNLVLNIPAHVSILVTDSNSLTIVAQENIVENIDIKRKNNRLIIQSNRILKSNKPIEIIITCTSLKGIELNGSGNIDVINQYSIPKANFTINGSGKIQTHLEAKEIKSQINGSGEMKFSGAVQKLKIEINGSGDIIAQDLLASNCDIDINGSGKVDLTVKNKLDVSIVGSGDVTYAGDPIIKSYVTGNGKIKSINKEK
jgi:Putative auto-transporter adhesin, head GIN domain